MTLTAPNTNRLCVLWYFIQMMRIRKSLALWWESWQRHMKTNLLLIYLKNSEKSWRIKGIHYFHLLMSLKSSKKYHLYKLKLFSNMLQHDDNNQELLQQLLFKRNHQRIYSKRHHNNSELELEQQWLLWVLWDYCWRYRIPLDCWLRRKTWFIHSMNKNKAHRSSMRRSERNHCDKQCWGISQWIQTRKELMNYYNLSRRNESNRILKENEIRA